MLRPSHNNILIFGGSGLVGSAILKRFLDKSGESQNNVIAPKRSEVNLLDYSAIVETIEKFSPNLIIMAAGEVAGISYNSEHQSEMYSSNLLMNYNLLKAAFDFKVPNLLLVSSSCIYPSNLKPPFSEIDLFMGLPEPTNDGYAAAKLAAIRQLLLYRKNYSLDWQVCIPTNVYGISNIDIEKAHVIPQMVHKIMQAKEQGLSRVEFFGDGTPIREFIFSSDLAEAIYLICSKNLPHEIINVSGGKSITINDLSKLIVKVCRYEGEIDFNSDFPNGHPNKSLDTKILMDLNWIPKVSLATGISLFLDDYSKFFQVKEA